METVETYRTAIQQILSEYAKIPFSLEKDVVTEKKNEGGDALSTHHIFFMISAHQSYTSWMCGGMRWA